MQTADNICFLQILRLHDAELWQTKDGVLSLKSKGNLQVLYSKEMNLFGLKFNDFKFNLGKNLQVVGSYCGHEGYYSYNIPTFDGYYTIKILESQTGPALTNFETFLSNTCQFIRKDNLQQDLHRPESKLKETLHKTLDTITNVFHHQEKETEPNHRLVRSFQDMLVLDGHQAHMVDIPSVEILNILQETGEVIRNHQDTEAWLKIRGEYQPILIESGENLFVNKDETTTGQKWGSNVTNASTRSDKNLSGGSLEGGRLGQSNLGQNPSLSSNVLSGSNFRTGTSTQPFDQSNLA